MSESEQGIGIQAELPLAIVGGESLTKLPDDLYIPPDALEVFLEAFEGPLDLLLYLIKRQNIEILDIPIADIAAQYVAYVELMKDFQLELAAEYLVMAAMLAEIKSRMLLPRPVSEEGDEVDPRAELIKRLQEYERYKSAAEDLDTMPRVYRDIYPVQVDRPKLQLVKARPKVNIHELTAAFQDVLRRCEMFKEHQIVQEPLSVRERMVEIINKISAVDYAEFSTLFKPEEGRIGVVVTFLAILELVKESVLEAVQNEPFSPIHIRARS